MAGYGSEETLRRGTSRVAQYRKYEVREKDNFATIYGSFGWGESEKGTARKGKSEEIIK